MGSRRWPREFLAYIGEVLSVLAEELGENSLPLEPLLIFEDVAVHEAIHHGGVGVDVNVKLQTCFLLRERITNDQSKATECALQGPDTKHSRSHTHACTRICMHVSFL